MELDLYAQTISSDVPIGYIVMDTQFNIVYINDYFRKALKSHRSSPLTKKCYNICNGYYQCSECIVKEVIETHTTQRACRRVIEFDGSHTYNDIVAVPIFNAKNRLQFIMEIVIDKTEETEYHSSLEKSYLLLIDSISKVLDKKDNYTAFHSANVKHYSLYMGKYFNLNEADQKKLLIAASLHDIGKIGIPDSILLKPGRLTNEESEIFKTHPERGARIISKIKYFKDIADIVRYHHERADGKGYPYGLKGNEIPFMAKIVSVADTFDAMTTNRVYRSALSTKDAANEIKKYSGTQFDKHIADAFVYLVENEVIKPIYTNSF